jgi:hypothetical protein
VRVGVSDGLAAAYEPSYASHVGYGIRKWSDAGRKWSGSPWHVAGSEPYMRFDEPCGFRLCRTVGRRCPVRDVVVDVIPETYTSPVEDALSLAFYPESEKETPARPKPRL